MAERPRLYRELQDMIDEVLGRLGTPSSTFAALFEDMLNMLMYIAILRRYIDQGRGFAVIDRFEGVSNGDSRYIYIENPQGSGVVMEIIELSFIGTAKGRVNMYTQDRFSVSSPGTPFDVLNLNGDDNEPSVGVYGGGTFNITGNPKGKNIITGGSRNKAIGGELAVNPGLKIREGKRILIEVNNNSGGSADYAFRMIWVEYPPS